MVITATKSPGYHKHMVIDGRCVLCKMFLFDPLERHDQIKAIEKDIAADFLKINAVDVCAKYRISRRTLYLLPLVREARAIKVLNWLTVEERKNVLAKFRKGGNDGS